MRREREWVSEWRYRKIVWCVARGWQGRINLPNRKKLPPQPIYFLFSLLFPMAEAPEFKSFELYVYLKYIAFHFIPLCDPYIERKAPPWDVDRVGWQATYNLKRSMEGKSIRSPPHPHTIVDMKFFHFLRFFFCSCSALLALLLLLLFFSPSRPRSSQRVHRRKSIGENPSSI